MERVPAEPYLREMTDRFPSDIDDAREQGEAFGSEVGRQAAGDMMQTGLADNEIKLIGAEAISSVIGRADALANAGLDREIVSAWVEAAAEAFNRELDQAVSLLRASGSAH